MIWDLALASWAHFVIPGCGREQARHLRQCFQGSESLFPPLGNIKDKVSDLLVFLIKTPLCSAIWLLDIPTWMPDFPVFDGE